MELFSIIILIISALALSGGVLLAQKSQKFKAKANEQNEETKRRMYELAILKELGDRTGYSLDVQNIIDIITGSLRQFIDYSAVSYMLIEPEKLIFKVHLEKSVSRGFVDDIKKRMVNSLTALSGEDTSKQRIEEVLSGVILVDEIKEPIRSFFNIPLVIGEKLVGVLTIADTKPGLYKEEEMTILYKISRQASNAVTRLQEVVQNEQRKLNSVLQSMNDGVVMTDKDYRIVVVNPAAKKIVGIENKKEVTIFDFIDNLEGKFDIRGKLEESVKLNKVLVVSDVLIQQKFLQISVLPVKSNQTKDNQEMLGGAVIFHDITQEKEIEKLKEDFTSMIAHELRSPLDGIRKMAEVVRTCSVKKVQKEEYFQQIYQSSSEMLGLISNLLDSAKIEAGKFEILKQPHDIKQVVAGRVDFFSALAKDNKVKVSKVLDKNLPEMVSFDEYRIGQVLNNFLSNAIKFSKVGGKIMLQVLLHKKGESIATEAEQAKIKWFLQQQDIAKLTLLDNCLVVGITDNGEGIAQEDISQLFNKFKQAKTAHAKKGTGLGLVIAKGIVQAHKGIVGVASEQGVGSTFYFTIPL